MFFQAGLYISALYGGKYLYHGHDSYVHETVPMAARKRVLPSWLLCVPW